MFGQNNDNVSLQGDKDSLVAIDIATVRKATIKLREREYLKDVVEQQDTIINNQKIIIDKYKEYNLYLADENLLYKNSYEEIQKVNDNLNKSIHWKNVGLYVLGGTTVISVATIVILCVIGNGK